MAINMTPEQMQQDRIVSAYHRAVVALEEAASAVKAPLPHNPRTIRALKKAQDDLGWYLSELDHARG